MKKIGIIIIILLIIILLIFILLKSGVVKPVLNNYRLQKIEKFNTSNKLSTINIEDELQQLYLNNNFKKGGYVYNISQQENMTIESLSAYAPFAIEELDPEASFRIYIDNNEETGILLTISTSKNGMIRKLKNGSDGSEITINQYMSQLIQSKQKRKDKFTVSRSNIINNKPDNVYYQKVYEKLINNHELTFYNCFSYEWFPYFNRNTEGLPYFTNLDNPTIREYQAYLYSDTFLVKFNYSSFEGWDEVEVKKLQSVVFDVLNNIHIYVPQSL